MQHFSRSFFKFKSILLVKRVSFLKTAFALRMLLKLSLKYGLRLCRSSSGMDIYFDILEKLTLVSGPSFFIWLLTTVQEFTLESFTIWCNIYGCLKPRNIQDLFGQDTKF